MLDKKFRDYPMSPAKKSAKPKVKCPKCGADIELDAKTAEGELIECPDCSCELEIVKKGDKLDVECLSEKWQAGDDLGENEETEDLD